MYDIRYFYIEDYIRMSTESSYSRFLRTDDGRRIEGSLSDLKSSLSYQNSILQQSKRSYDSLRSEIKKFPSSENRRWEDDRKLERFIDGMREAEEYIETLNLQIKKYEEEFSDGIKRIECADLAAKDAAKAAVGGRRKSRKSRNKKRKTKRRR
jgi:hypothetical protein